MQHKTKIRLIRFFAVVALIGLLLILNFFKYNIFSNHKIRMDRNIRHLEMYNACSHPFFTDGEVISYYNKKDSLIKWETFYKNRKIIKLREYYQTGELYYEMPIRKCARHGNVKYYHKNGTVLYDIHYNYGFKNGIITEYFENNTTKKIINYKDNLRHGEYLEYDSLGVLITKHKYYEGELIH